MKEIVELAEIQYYKETVDGRNIYTPVKPTTMLEKEGMQYMEVIMPQNIMVLLPYCEETIEDLNKGKIVTHELWRSTLPKWAKRKVEYMEEEQKEKLEFLYKNLQGKIYLMEINEKAKKHYERFIEMNKINYGITEELKKTDYLKWIQLNENLRMTAEKATLNKMIYQNN